MSDDTLNNHTVGWIGTGRMGYAMVARLVEAGCDVTVYNRTRAKAEPLAENGAKIVDTPAELADRDIVFTMVAGPADLEAVIAGPQGVLSNTSATPEIFVDCTSVDDAASEVARQAAAARGAAFVASPVSGNAKVVKAGKLTRSHRARRRHSIRSAPCWKSSRRAARPMSARPTWRGP